MTSSAINTAAQSQEFREVTVSELKAISGGWFPVLYGGLLQYLASRSQEDKVLDFLNQQLSIEL